MLGIMIDCSRNAVMKISEVKKFAQYMKDFGYDTLMLYTEDTFEVSNEPCFGYKRGRYSKSEIKELDAFCNSIGIELIPCVQTLAHLNGIFKWYEVYYEINDVDDILLIDEDRTYELINNIFATVSECFTTKKVHIGMDEAFRVGLGKYLEKNGYKDRFDVINGHLHKVCKIADKYGLEPMLWGDMFLKLALNNEDYYEEGKAEDIIRRADLPENVTLVYWDYYSEDYNRYVDMISKTKLFGRSVNFAGGIWTWRGFAPDNAFSIKTMYSAVKACRDCGIDNTFFCLWGDDGAECSKYSVFAAMLYIAEISKGNFNLDDIKAKFKAKFDMNFDDIILLDRLDGIGGKHTRGSDSKCLLYNDPFSGLLDAEISGNENEYYKNLLVELNKVDVKAPFELTFKYLRMLCDVLSVKSELGVKTRALYKSGDKTALLKLANTDYTESIEKTKKFHRALGEMWFNENKPHGFDVQDIRIGALLQRLESCKQRLIDYCEGKVKEIPELEEEVIKNTPLGTYWGRIVSPNVLSHKF